MPVLYVLGLCQLRPKWISQLDESESERFIFLPAFTVCPSHFFSTPSQLHASLPLGPHILHKDLVMWSEKVFWEMKYINTHMMFQNTK